jgi:lysylphosphatidylglycerol synthetase-like protein (DUF2156 family)
MSNFFSFVVDLGNNLSFLYTWMPLPILNMFTLVIGIVGIIIVINLVVKIAQIIK